MTKAAEEEFTVPRELVLEMRALQAELELAVTKTRALEAVHAELANKIGALIIEGGAYEVTSPLELTTGVVKRRRVTAVDAAPPLVVKRGPRNAAVLRRG